MAMLPADGEASSDCETLPREAPGIFPRPPLLQASRGGAAAAAPRLPLGGIHRNLSRDGLSQTLVDIVARCPADYSRWALFAAACRDGSAVSSSALVPVGRGCASGNLASSQGLASTNHSSIEEPPDELTHESACSSESHGWRSLCVFELAQEAARRGPREVADDLAAGPWPEPSGEEALHRSSSATSSDTCLGDMAALCGEWTNARGCMITVVDGMCRYETGECHPIVVRNGMITIYGWNLVDVGDDPKHAKAVWKMRGRRLEWRRPGASICWAPPCPAVAIAGRRAFEREMQPYFAGLAAGSPSASGGQPLQASGSALPARGRSAAAAGGSNSGSSKIAAAGGRGTRAAATAASMVVAGAGSGGSRSSRSGRAAAVALDDEVDGATRWAGDIYIRRLATLFEELEEPAELGALRSEAERRARLDDLYPSEHGSLKASASAGNRAAEEAEVGGLLWDEEEPAHIRGCGELPLKLGSGSGRDIAAQMLMPVLRCGLGSSMTALQLFAPELDRILEVLGRGKPLAGVSSRFDEEDGVVLGQVAITRSAYAGALRAAVDAGDSSLAARILDALLLLALHRGEAEGVLLWLHSLWCDRSGDPLSLPLTVPLRGLWHLELLAATAPLARSLAPAGARSMEGGCDLGELPRRACFPPCGHFVLVMHFPALARMGDEPTLLLVLARAGSSGSAGAAPGSIGDAVASADGPALLRLRLGDAGLLCEGEALEQLQVSVHHSGRDASRVLVEIVLSLPGTAILLVNGLERARLPMPPMRLLAAAARSTEVSVIPQSKACAALIRPLPASEPESPMSAAQVSSIAMSALNSIAMHGMLAWDASASGEGRSMNKWLPLDLVYDKVSDSVVSNVLFTTMEQPQNTQILNGGLQTWRRPNIDAGKDPRTCTTWTLPEGQDARISMRLDCLGAWASIGVAPQSSASKTIQKVVGLSEGEISLGVLSGKIKWMKDGRQHEQTACEKCKDGDKITIHWNAAASMVSFSVNGEEKGEAVKLPSAEPYVIAVGLGKDARISMDGLEMERAGFSSPELLSLQTDLLQMHTRALARPLTEGGCWKLSDWTYAAESACALLGLIFVGLDTSSDAPAPARLSSIAIKLLQLTAPAPPRDVASGSGGPTEQQPADAKGGMQAALVFFLHSCSLKLLAVSAPPESRLEAQNLLRVLVEAAKVESLAPAMKQLIDVWGRRGTTVALLELALADSVLDEISTSASAQTFGLAAHLARTRWRMAQARSASGLDGSAVLDAARQRIIILFKRASAILERQSPAALAALAPHISPLLALPKDLPLLVRTLPLCVELCQRLLGWLSPPPALRPLLRRVLAATCTLVELLVQGGERQSGFAASDKDENVMLPSALVAHARFQADLDHPLATALRAEFRTGGGADATPQPPQQLLPGGSTELEAEGQSLASWMERGPDEQAAAEALEAAAGQPLQAMSPQVAEAEALASAIVRRLAGPSPITDQEMSALMKGFGRRLLSEAQQAVAEGRDRQAVLKRSEEVAAWVLATFEGSGELPAAASSGSRSARREGMVLRSPRPMRRLQTSDGISSMRGTFNLVSGGAVASSHALLFKRLTTPGSCRIDECVHQIFDFILKPPGDVEVLRRALQRLQLRAVASVFAAIMLQRLWLVSCPDDVGGTASEAPSGPRRLPRRSSEILLSSSGTLPPQGCGDEVAAARVVQAVMVWIASVGSGPAAGADSAGVAGGAATNGGGGGDAVGSGLPVLPTLVTQAVEASRCALLTSIASASWGCVQSKALRLPLQLLAAPRPELQDLLLPVWRPLLLAAFPGALGTYQSQGRSRVEAAKTEAERRAREQFWAAFAGATLLGAPLVELLGEVLRAQPIRSGWAGPSDAWLRSFPREVQGTAFAVHVLHLLVCTLQVRHDAAWDTLLQQLPWDRFAKSPMAQARSLELAAEAASSRWFGLARWPRLLPLPDPASDQLQTDSSSVSLWDLVCGEDETGEVAGRRGVASSAGGGGTVVLQPRQPPRSASKAFGCRLVCAAPLQVSPLASSTAASSAASARPGPGPTGLVFRVRRPVCLGAVVLPASEAASAALVHLRYRQLHISTFRKQVDDGTPVPETQVRFAHLEQANSCHLLDENRTVWRPGHAPGLDPRAYSSWTFPSDQDATVYITIVNGGGWSAIGVAPVKSMMGEIKQVVGRAEGEVALGAKSGKIASMMNGEDTSQADVFTPCISGDHVTMYWQSSERHLLFAKNGDVAGKPVVLPSGDYAICVGLGREAKLRLDRVEVEQREPEACLGDARPHVLSKLRDEDSDGEEGFLLEVGVSAATEGANAQEESMAAAVATTSRGNWHANVVYKRNGHLAHEVRMPINTPEADLRVVFLCWGACELHLDELYPTADMDEDGLPIDSSPVAGIRPLDAYAALPDHMRSVTVQDNSPEMKELSVMAGSEECSAQERPWRRECARQSVRLMQARLRAPALRNQAVEELCSELELRLEDTGTSTAKRAELLGRADAALATLCLPAAAPGDEAPGPEGLPKESSVVPFAWPAPGDALEADSVTTVLSVPELEVLLAAVVRLLCGRAGTTSLAELLAAGSGADGAAAVGGGHGGPAAVAAVSTITGAEKLPGSGVQQPPLWGHALLAAARTLEALVAARELPDADGDRGGVEPLPSSSSGNLFEPLTQACKRAFRRGFSSDTPLVVLQGDATRATLIPASTAAAKWSLAPQSPTAVGASEGSERLPRTTAALALERPRSRALPADQCESDVDSWRVAPLPQGLHFLRGVSVLRIAPLPPGGPMPNMALLMPAPGAPAPGAAAAAPGTAAPAAQAAPGGAGAASPGGGAAANTAAARSGAAVAKVMGSPLVVGAPRLALPPDGVACFEVRIHSCSDDLRIGWAPHAFTMLGDLHVGDVLCCKVQQSTGTSAPTISFARNGDWSSPMKSESGSALAGDVGAMLSQVPRDRSFLVLVATEAELALHLGPDFECEPAAAEGKGCLVASPPTPELGRGHPEAATWPALRALLSNAVLANDLPSELSLAPRASATSWRLLPIAGIGEELPPPPPAGAPPSPATAAPHAGAGAAVAAAPVPPAAVGAAAAAGPGVAHAAAAAAAAATAATAAAPAGLVANTVSSAAGGAPAPPSCTAACSALAKVLTLLARLHPAPMRELLVAAQQRPGATSATSGSSVTSDSWQMLRFVVRHSGGSAARSSSDRMALEAWGTVLSGLPEAELEVEVLCHLEAATRVGRDGLIGGLDGPFPEVATFIMQCMEAVGKPLSSPRIWAATLAAALHASPVYRPQLCRFLTRLSPAALPLATAQTALFAIVDVISEIHMLVSTLPNYTSFQAGLGLFAACAQSFAAVAIALLARGDVLLPEQLPSGGDGSGSGGGEATMSRAGEPMGAGSSQRSAGADLICALALATAMKSSTPPPWTFARQLASCPTREVLLELSQDRSVMVAVSPSKNGGSALELCCEGPWRPATVALASPATALVPEAISGSTATPAAAEPRRVVVARGPDFACVVAELLLPSGRVSLPAGHYWVCLTPPASFDSKDPDSLFGGVPGVELDGLVARAGSTATKRGSGSAGSSNSAPPGAGAGDAGIADLAFQHQVAPTAAPPVPRQTTAIAGATEVTPPAPLPPPPTPAPEAPLAPAHSPVGMAQVHPIATRWIAVNVVMRAGVGIEGKSSRHSHDVESVGCVRLTKVSCVEVPDMATASQQEGVTAGTAEQPSTNTASALAPEARPAEMLLPLAVSTPEPAAPATEAPVMPVEPLGAAAAEADLAYQGDYAELAALFSPRSSCRTPSEEPGFEDEELGVEVSLVANAADAMEALPVAGSVEAPSANVEEPATASPAPPAATAVPAPLLTAPASAAGAPGSAQALERAAPTAPAHRGNQPPAEPLVRQDANCSAALPFYATFQVNEVQDGGEAAIGIDWRGQRWIWHGDGRFEAPVLLTSLSTATPAQANAEFEAEIPGPDATDEAATGEAQVPSFSAGDEVSVEFLPDEMALLWSRNGMPAFVYHFVCSHLTMSPPSQSPWEAGNAANNSISMALSETQWREELEKATTIAKELLGNELGEDTAMPEGPSPSAHQDEGNYSRPVTIEVPFAVLEQPDACELLDNGFVVRRPSNLIGQDPRACTSWTLPERSDATISLTIRATGAWSSLGVVPATSVTREVCKVVGRGPGELSFGALSGNIMRASNELTSHVEAVCTRCLDGDKVKMHWDHKGRTIAFSVNGTRVGSAPLPNREPYVVAVGLGKECCIAINSVEVLDPVAAGIAVSDEVAVPGDVPALEADISVAAASSAGSAPHSEHPPPPPLVAPDQEWPCPRCPMLCEAGSSHCDACGAPYAELRRRTAPPSVPLPQRQPEEASAGPARGRFASMLHACSLPSNLWRSGVASASGGQRSSGLASSVRSRLLAPPAVAATVRAKAEPGKEEEDSPVEPSKETEATQAAADATPAAPPTGPFNELARLRALSPDIPLERCPWPGLLRSCRVLLGLRNASAELVSLELDGELVVGPNSTGAATADAPAFVAPPSPALKTPPTALAPMLTGGTATGSGGPHTATAAQRAVAAEAKQLNTLRLVFADLYRAIGRSYFDLPTDLPSSAGVHWPAGPLLPAAHRLRTAASAFTRALNEAGKLMARPGSLLERVLDRKAPVHSELSGTQESPAAVSEWTCKLLLEMCVSLETDLRKHLASNQIVQRLRFWLIHCLRRQQGLVLEEQPFSGEAGQHHSAASQSVGPGLCHLRARLADDSASGSHPATAAPSAGSPVVARSADSQQLEDAWASGWRHFVEAVRAFDRSGRPPGEASPEHQRQIPPALQALYAAAARGSSNDDFRSEVSVDQCAWLHRAVCAAEPLVKSALPLIAPVLSSQEYVLPPDSSPAALPPWGELRSFLSTQERDAMWHRALFGEHVFSGEQSQMKLQRGQALLGGSVTSKSVWYQLSTHLQGLSPAVLRTNEGVRPFKVTFEGEGAQDAGGPFQDALSTVCEEVMAGIGKIFIASPNKRLGLGSGQDTVVLHPKPPDQVAKRMLRSLGMLFGIALRTKTALDLTLNIVLWRRLLTAQSPTRAEMGAADLMTMQMLDRLEALSTEEEVQALDGLTFCAEDSAGQLVELQAGRCETEVRTVADAQKLAKLIQEMRSNEGAEAVEELAAGVEAVLPLGLARLLFSPEDFEEMVCGQADVDIVRLKRHTTMSREHSAQEPSCGWLWEALESFSPQQRRRFLRFVSGRQRLPPGVGWNMNCAIQPDRSPEALPTSATCSFALYLPRYSCYEHLRSKLLQAIEHVTTIDLDGGAHGQLTL